jgi:hypothetical protein
MANPSSVVLFRISSFPVPFAIYVDEEGFAVVDDGLLCLCFNLQEATLLVEREEVDSNGCLIRIIYQKPCITEIGSYYRVTPGSYNIIGGVTSFNMSQASTLMPRSAASFKCRAIGR